MQPGNRPHGAGAPLEAATRNEEQALRRSELRYRRVFEAAHDGILILDADSGRIIDVNPYLVELLGYPRGEFLGRQLWDFEPFRAVVASRQAFDALRATGSFAHEDLALQTRDGRSIDVGFVSNAYLEGDASTIQCHIRDITGRKRADRHQASLEDQLRAAQKLEAIGGLAGGIAHDFNNLLAVILGYTELACDELPPGSPILASLLEVVKATNGATELTRRLLAFGRKQVLQPVPIVLNHVLLGVEKMLRRILGEDIELIYTLDLELGTTIADLSQLEQVVMNLMVNARDAMPTGGRLSIETANVELDAVYASLYLTAKPGPYVMLAVSDTGIGMDAATQARIFEPFFTTKSSDKGTGLGLSIVHGIVRQCGGTLRVSSTVGRGTTFAIYFPRCFAAQAAKSPSPLRDAVRVATPGAQTILVVEDDEAVRHLAHRVLADAGYEVLAACDGREALMMCATSPRKVALVLVDIVMPKMSGQMFAAQLRRLHPGTKILFMSGHPDGTIFNHGGVDTGTRFIGKPFSTAELADRVREILDECG